MPLALCSVEQPRRRRTATIALICASLALLGAGTQTWIALHPPATRVAAVRSAGVSAADFDVLRSRPRPDPGRCPSAGAGPVTLRSTAPVAGRPFLVDIAAAAGYRGPVVIRGHQVGGRAPLYANSFTLVPVARTWGSPLFETSGLVLYGEVDLEAPGTAAAWTATGFAPLAGCYAWEVQGAGFRYPVVFLIARL